MNLILTKPLAFFDLETTGIDISKDRIVEISILKVHPNGQKEDLTKRINPEIPIPIEASEVHGIYDFDVLNEPTFQQIAEEIAQFIGDADLAGYNSNRFDVPLLVEEFLRVGIDFDMTNRKLVDVQSIFYKQEQRTLEAAYKFYCGKELNNAHSAEADIKATFEILESQIQRYDDIQGDIDFLSDYTEMRGELVDFAGRIVYNSDKEPCFNFGKHKGRPVTEVLRREPSYYAWMMQGDFPAYTKKVLSQIKESM